MLLMFLNTNEMVANYYVRCNNFHVVATLPYG